MSSHQRQESLQRLSERKEVTKVEVHDGGPQLNNIQYDRDTIQEFAEYLADKRCRRAAEAGIPVPEKEEVIEQTTWALENFYDSSDTLKNFHEHVRTTDDQRRLQYFLDSIPLTVLRDMSVSAMSEEDRQVKKRADIVQLLDRVLKMHLQTSNAALHLLERFKNMADPEVDWVRSKLKDSHGYAARKRQEFEDAGVLRKEN